MRTDKLLRFRRKQASRVRSAVACGFTLSLAACQGSANPSRSSADVVVDSGTTALPVVAHASTRDSSAVQDATRFNCGRVRGAVSGPLTCDRTFPDMVWDCQNGTCEVQIHASLALPDGSTFAGSLPGVALTDPLIFPGICHIARVFRAA